MPLFFQADPLLCQRSESGLESMLCRTLSLLRTTSFGSTEWIFSGILGGFSAVSLSVKNGVNRSIASFNLFSLRSRRCKIVFPVISLEQRSRDSGKPLGQLDDLCTSW